MKKVKIFIETVVKNNEVLEDLKENINNELLKHEIAPWCSSTKVNISQNTDNKRKNFKAGQIYRILGIEDNKIKYLLLTSTGSLYIKGIIITDKGLEKIRSISYNTESFKDLSETLKECIYCYTYYDGDIYCPYNHYCSIIDRIVTEDIESNDYIALELEYFDSIEDEKLACII